MGYYILKRLAFMVIVLFVLTIVTFFLTTIAPSDPAGLWIGPRPKPGQLERARKELGLDKPAHIRYVLYLRKLLKGDFGMSIRTRRPVMDELKRYFPATIELVTVAMILSLIVGIPLGIYTAFHRESLMDHGGRIFSLSGVAVPIFWLGMMFQLAFYSAWQILPLQGRISSYVLLTDPVESMTGFYFIDSLITGNWIAFKSSLVHMILPAVTLSFASLAFVVRITRSSVIEVMNEDYIRTAKAFGVGENLIRYKYALKNGLIPVVTVVGLSYAYELGGSILVESIFDWPGMGKFMWLSIINNDYPGIIGVTITFAIICCTINLIVDLIYALIDPRVRPMGN
jgi:peptide/nickel transport system permease protein